jgi:hypothetical protein
MILFLNPYSVDSKKEKNLEILKKKSTTKEEEEKEEEEEKK